MSIPPYFLRHLYNVVFAIPCLRHNSKMPLPAFRFTQNPDDLLLRETLSFHDFFTAIISAPFPTQIRTSFRGAGQSHLRLSLLSDWNASGQPPWRSMTSSISSMRRMVLARTVTIFW